MAEGRLPKKERHYDFLAIYTNGNRPSTHPRRRLVGTAHRGPHWVNAVRILRSATQNAVEHAGWRRSATANEVGSTIIDGIGELDGKCLHVLDVVFSILTRTSQHNQ